MSAATNENSSLSHSSVVLTEEKFHGILDVSKTQIFKRSFFSFIYYIYSIYLPNRIYLIIVSIWRCLQFMVPGFFAGNELMYPKGGLMRSIMGAFSVINQIVPASVESYYYPIFAGIYIFIFFVVVVVSCICTFVLEKTGKIPRLLCALLVIYFEGPWYLLQPIIFSVTGNQLGRKFLFEDNVQDAAAWILFVIILIFHIFFTVITYSAISISLTFRPTSLATYHFRIQTILVQSACILGFLAGINPFCSKISRIIINVLVLLISALLFVVCFGFLSIIRNNNMSFFVANISQSIFGCIVVIICEILEVEVPPITLLIDVIVIVIAHITHLLLFKRYVIKATQKLDMIENDSSSLMNAETKTNKITEFHEISLITVGFANSHPFVLSWEFLRMLEEKYPKSETLYLLWARFCSAFPEETRQLMVIDKQLGQLKLHKDYIIHFRSQITFLVRQRESSMTHVLKRKLNHSIREMQFAKNRLRHFWECVIQGNTNDMLSAAAAAQESVRSSEFDLLHLINSYPNNQYVSRLYSRFLLNVRGDKLEYKIWHNNTEQLKSGQNIIADSAQQETLELFPNILSMTVQKENISIVTGLFGESTTSAPTFSSSTMKFEDEEDDQVIMLNSVRDSIQKMKIPSISCTNILLIIFSILFLLICIPIVIVYYYISMKGQLDVTSLISAASDLRMVISNLFFVSSLHLSECLGAVFPIEYTPDLANVSLTESLPFLGGSMNRTVQGTYLINRIDRLLDQIRDITIYDYNNNRFIAYAHSAIFDSIHSVETVADIDITGSYTLVDEIKSAESAIISIKTVMESLFSISTQLEAATFIKSSDLSNAYINLNVSLDGLNYFCMNLTNYVRDNVSTANDITCYLSYAIYFVVGVYVIILVIYVIIQITREKRIIIKAFLTLPKHIISKIVDTLKISGQQEIECDTSNSEVGDIQRNKQEENFLALLGTTSTFSSNLFNGITFLAFVIFIIGIVTCLLYFGLCEWLMDSSDIILYVTPDTNYFLWSISSLAIATNQYYRLMLYDLNASLVIDTNRLDIINLGNFYNQLAINQYFAVIYGNQTLGVTELCLFYPELADVISTNGDPVYIMFSLNMHGVYSNLSPDSLICFYTIQLPRLFVDAETVLTYPGITITYLTEMLLNHIYDKSFAPLNEQLRDNIEGIFLNMFTLSMIKAVGIYIVLVILVFASFLILNKLKGSLKWMAESLLMCPPDVLMNSKQILRLLTGQFKENKRLTKSSEQGNLYFETLIDKFVDAVIFIKPDLTIYSINPSTSRILGIPEEEILNQKLSSLFTPPKDGDGGIDNFIEELKEALSGHRSLRFSCNIETVKPDGSSLSLHINITALSKKGIIENLNETKTQIKYITIVARDISQSVRSKKLLKEERARSDSLLRHILPPVIADSLQKGDKDISFAVSSASIVFMDVVEFTPWCASNTAQTVMATLNRAFKEFDWLLSLHQTLTKMKCIGDCYVAAGGIFDEPNIPSVHAREMTNFGCLAIKAIRKVDEEINQPLRIRVGINTGGPIAAGVLGVDRPTFEIFGPTINMAQQMEHHGIPMMVHVSRSVYELIYDSYFDIKERGEVEVKNGKVLTYIVDPAPIPYPEGGP